MTGRRIPDGKWWDDDAHPAPWQVGDYCLDEDKGGVWVQVPMEGAPDGSGPVHLPTQHHANPAEQTRWTLTENEDGTLTLHPSIFVNAPTGFHGWLTNGELVGA